MESVKIVHCADLHIGAQNSALGERADSRRAEYLLTFERIIELCRKNGTDILLIAGDLFDTAAVDKPTADRVFELISSIPETVVALSAGNHDPLTADSPYKTCRLPDNLHVFGDKMGVIELPDKNTKVYGISFVSGEFSSRLKIGGANDESINILLMHADLDADVNSRYNPVQRSVLSDSGMDYVALGHIHKRTEILNGNGVCFAYPGCAEPSGFDELGEKGVYAGTVSKGGVDLEFVPLSYRRFEEIETYVTNLSSSAEIVDKTLCILKEKFGENYSKNFYKIILTGNTDEPFVPDLQYIRTNLADKVYYAKVKSKAGFNIDYETLSREFTLKGIFTRRMLEKINAAEESDKARLENALRLGLCAFDTEVKPYES